MDAQAIIDTASELLVNHGPRALTALGILIVGYWLAKILSNLARRALGARNVDPTIGQFIGKLVFGTTLAVALIPALSHAGIQTTSVLAALGAAGLAVGLALQGSLSNFAAGVLLIAFRPCRVGDYVEAGGKAGTVAEISLFSTTLLTPDNVRITLPNAAVMSSPITNYSAMDQRRVDLLIGISYDANIKLAKEVIQSVINADERVLAEPAPVIAVRELADSSVNLVVRPWVSRPDYWNAHDDLLENIKLALDEAGVTIPFPQMDVHFFNEQSQIA